MKEILDAVVLTLFIIMLIYFIKGFNKEQLDKHEKKMKKKMKSQKENQSNDKTTTN
jgi:uncharacterized membrane protein